MLNNFRRKRSLTMHVNVNTAHALKFCVFNFVARVDYENILTTKISRFTVYTNVHVHCIYVYVYSPFSLDFLQGASSSTVTNIPGISVHAWT